MLFWQQIRWIKSKLNREENNINKMQISDYENKGEIVLCILCNKNNVIDILAHTLTYVIIL